MLMCINCQKVTSDTFDKFNIRHFNTLAHIWVNFMRTKVRF